MAAVGAGTIICGVLAQYMPRPQAEHDTGEIIDALEAAGYAVVTAQVARLGALRADAGQAEVVVNVERKDLCRWCGETHVGKRCPKVKALEYASDGVTVSRVEFLAPNDYPPLSAMPTFGDLKID